MAGQPLSAEQRDKLVKQKEQYEKAAEKLEDQVGENCAFLLRLTYLREGVKKNRRFFRK